MLAGLIYRGDYEMRLTVAGGGASAFPEVGVAGGSCSLVSHFTPDYLTKAVGIAMTGIGQTGAVTEATAILEVPMIGLSQSRTFSGETSVSMHTKLIDLRVYIEVSGSWSIRCAGLEWRVNGVLEHSHGSFSYFSPMTCVPSALPLIGIPPTMTPGSTLDPLLALGSCLPVGYPGGPAGNAVVTASGGWRLKPFGGTFVELPISVAPNDFVSGTDTYNVELTSTYEQVNDPGYTAETGSGYSIWIIPNSPSSLKRIDASYESLIFRWGADGYGIRAGSGTQIADCIGTVISDTTSSSDTTIYAAKTQLLSTVTNSPHVIEDLFTGMQCWLSGGITTNFAAIGSVGFTNEGQQWLQLSSGSPSGALTHLDTNARFVNQWMSPHWAYGLWFPPNSSASSARWDLLGGDADIAYFYDIRQQHNTHPALPGGENTQRRVNVTTEPINQNSIIGVADNVLGLPCWWGNCRFSAEKEVFPTQFATNSTSATRFAFKNGASAGTGSVGAGITIDAGSDAVEFDLASFTVFPYMTTTLADRIKQAWSDSNVSAVKLFAVGIDGSSVPIGATSGITSDTTYRIPFGQAKRWVTSAGADFGDGFLVDGYIPDAGVSAYDITPTVINDARYTSSFGLLPGFSPVKIRIEVVRTSGYTGAVTIGHPTFFMAPWSTAKCFHESGLVSTVLFEDGPAVRYGALSFYDWLADAPLSVPNAVTSVTNKTTIGDAWAWENCFLRGQSALTGLAARMATEYVENEEFPAGVIKHLWRYSDGESYFIDSLSGVVNSAIGPRLWYLNTFRNCPPLAVLPEKERLTGSGWDTTGDYKLISYSDISSKHPHIVSGVDQPELVQSAVNHLVPDIAPSGWSVGTFSDAVNNSEALEWVLRWGATNWASVRPWHGFLWVLGRSTSGLFGLRMCRDEHLGFLHLVVPSSSGVTLLSWNEKQGTERTRAVTSDESKLAGIAWSAESRLLVVVYDFDDSGTIKIKRTQTDSQGLSWSVPEVLWDGKGCDNVFDGQGREYVSYWFDGKFRVKVRLAPGQAWQGPYDIATSAEEGTTTIEQSPDASAPMVVVTMVQTSTTPEIRRYESVSGGRLWTETT
jgi:hypothetical protein